MRTMLQQRFGAAGLRMIMLAALVFAVGTAQAQTVITSVDFEADELGATYPGMGWDAADIVAEVVDNPVPTGNKVLRVIQGDYNAAPVLEFTLPAGVTLSDVTSLTFDAFFLQGDVGWKDIVVEAYGSMPTHEFNRSENRLGAYDRAMGASTEWEEITVDIANDSDLTGTVYVAFGINAAGTGNIGGDGVATTWFVDNVALIGSAAPAGPIAVSEWGFESNRIGDPWEILGTPEAGSISIGDPTGEYPPVGWAGIRGRFPTIELDAGQTIVLRGTMELVGGGLAVDDFQGASSLRYGLFHREGADTLQIVDGVWTAGTEGNHEGYLFMPPSGGDIMGNPSWQSVIEGSEGWGSVGVNTGGAWISTNAGGSYVLSQQLQRPTNATVPAGTYEFANSITHNLDGTTEVRFYVVNDDHSYWWGGTVTDDFRWPDSVGDFMAPHRFNAVTFAFGEGPSAARVNLTDVTVEVGDPIQVPEGPLPTVPMTPVAEWAFESNRVGDPWEILDTSEAGSISIGDPTGEYPPVGWAGIRGRFETIDLLPTQSVILRGTMELVGGGLAVGDFQGSSSLRYGLFHRSGADTLEIVDDRWPAGTEGAHAGYLFMPPSGGDIIGNPSWQSVIEGSEGWGSVGVNTGGAWISTNAAGSYVISQQLQRPPDAEIPAGTYEFANSITRNEDGTTEVRFYVVNEDHSYYWAGTATDDFVAHDTLGGGFLAPSQFNAVTFGFGEGPNATRVNLTNVVVGTDNAPITLPEYTLPTPPRGPHQVGAELLVNGSFDLSPVGPIENGIPYWSLNLVNQGSQGEAAIVEDPDPDRGRVMEIRVNDWNEDITSDWHIEAVNEPFYPVAGDSIIGTVWLRADADGRVANIFYGLPESGNWNRFPTGMGGTGGGGILVTLTDEWALYELPGHRVTARDEENTMRLGISLNHEENDQAVFHISDASVRIAAINVSSEADETIRQFTLDQNYPNPFNPVTTIAYEIATPNHVSLTIYNALGQRVATLVDGVQTSGSHRVQFNAQNLPSGVYFYQLRSEGNVVTKQMVLLK